MLRLGSSLELATVLQEAADSARALTRARYSLIVTIDESGAARDFVTSGLDPDEHRELAEWPDGPRLFAYLRDLPGSFRLADLPDMFRKLGYTDELVREKTLQGTPMRHRGVQVGNFFLAGKEDAPEFSAADEEMLELFASQAAAAIVNARTHQQERRARADLEALIETTPLGVMVFDAGTRRPVSSNREATRLIEPLREPDRPAEELPETVTCRLGDGREIALNELALMDELERAGKVRAEEIVLSVPDGRSVSMLVNSTPIHGEDGTVSSVVVTMQDLAPLQELDRLRSEFLGMVSHELRTPLAAIKARPQDGSTMFCHPACAAPCANSTILSSKVCQKRLLTRPGVAATRSSTCKLRRHIQGRRYDLRWRWEPGRSHRRQRSPRDKRRSSGPRSRPATSRLSSPGSWDSSSSMTYREHAQILAHFSASPIPFPTRPIRL